MHLLKYFNKLSLRPENAKELKGLILDLAIRGRLTEEWRKENSDTESALVLLDIINEKKNRLIKSKTIRREKTSEDQKENPYKIPIKWEWSSLSEVAYLKSGNSYKQQKQEGDYKFIKVSMMNLHENQVYITRSNIYIDSYSVKEKDLIPPNSIIFPKRGGAIATNKKRITIDHILVDPNIMALIPIESDTLEYINLWFSNFDLWSLNSGTSVPQINNKDISPLSIPIPPISEQKAIVQIVNQLMEEVDELETETNNRINLRQDFIQSSLYQLTTENSQQAWSDLEPHFKSFFDTEGSIDKLKETILQLAVQGKLTKQWREENPDIQPASVLLERIKEEKVNLMKEQKIRKEKPLPEIAEEEIPFELPDGWVWCRMGSVSHIIAGASFKSADFNQEDGVKCIKITNAGVGEFIETDDFLPISFKSKYPNYIIKQGDLILALTRPYIKNGLKISVCPHTYDESLLNQRVASIKSISKLIYHPYIFLFLKSPHVLNHYKSMYDDKSQQPNMKMKDIINLPISLPDLKEQKAIVQIVNQLMSSCNQMKSEIENRNNLSNNFLLSSIREVMEQTAGIS